MPAARRRSFSEDVPVSLTADVALRDSSVANLYTSLVQVQLAGTLLGALDTDGRVSGSVRVADNSLRSVVLELDDIILDDQRGRFAVYGVDGVVNWHADAETTPAASRISWDSGTVFNLIIGGGDVQLRLGDNDVELLRPLRLPTMGGALRINRLELHDFGSQAATGRLDAELEPVQLGQLTGALGWPAFSGTLSGRLPLLQLSENTVTVGGDLSAQLFDGTMTMSKLRIEQPFGRVPRLYADIAFRDLDLARVTETFSFGDIQGRLSGDMIDPGELAPGGDGCDILYAAGRSLAAPHQPACRGEPGECRWRRRHGGTVDGVFAVFRGFRL